MELLTDLVAQQRRCLIQPRAFFIAWCGVPMLTYHGFPVPLLNLKQQIQETIPHLAPENPGSKWAGTTLGALRDGNTLTLSELKTLREICDHFEPIIWQDETQFLVTELHYVLFACRSLEKRLLTQALPLKKGKFDYSAFPQKHLNWVQHIHTQFDLERLEDYLPSVQQAGHREVHYRNTHVEATLVIDLPDEQPSYLEAFIQEVNIALPSKYIWFAPESRHITVRALAFQNES